MDGRVLLLQPFLRRSSSSVRPWFTLRPEAVAEPQTKEQLSSETSELTLMSVWMFQGFLRRSSRASSAFLRRVGSVIVLVLRPGRHEWLIQTVPLGLDVCFCSSLWSTFCQTCRESVQLSFYQCLQERSHLVKVFLLIHPVCLLSLDGQRRLLANLKCSTF